MQRYARREANHREQLIAKFVHKVFCINFASHFSVVLLLVILLQYCSLIFDANVVRRRNN